jgi:hypothetical protein
MTDANHRHQLVGLAANALFLGFVLARSAFNPGPVASLVLLTFQVALLAFQVVLFLRVARDQSPYRSKGLDLRR